jgi:2-methylisocitrate lyase-like PEP mutase family enzyme
VNRPVNVIAGWLDPDITLAQLSEAGVKRISLGGASSRLALPIFVNAAHAVQECQSARERAPTFSTPNHNPRRSGPAGIIGVPRLG